jgi:Zn-dependent M28 family amino/carboxypeptidase
MKGATGWLLAVLLVPIGSVTLYMTSMPGRSYSESAPPLSLDERELRDRLTGHVWTLAGRIGERNLWRPQALEAAADYIERGFREWGYGVGSQEFVVANTIARNIDVEIPGTVLPHEVVLLGAHYDSILGSPGADDNATGIAAVLELARILAGRRLARSVRFVAFVNEEPPFFQTDDMGSRMYARRARERGENIVAMLSLESIGYYSDAKGSQDYPLLFRLFYPNRGNFLGFVGNIAARRLVHQTIRSFRRHAAFPSEGVAAPGWIMGIGWSDHWAFWKEGYPAIMVTDTALFRYEHYHSVTDTPDKIDYARLARVTAGMARVAVDLAGPGSGAVLQQGRPK